MTVGAGALRAEPALAGRRMPPAGVGNVVTVHAMHAGDHRVFIEAAAVRLRDVERIVLRFRRPWNDAAGVVALRAIDADEKYETQPRNKECLLSHIAPPAERTIGRRDAKGLPQDMPAPSMRAGASRRRRIKFANDSARNEVAARHVYTC